MNFLKNDRIEYGMFVGFIFFFIFLVFGVGTEIALFMGFLTMFAFWLIHLSVLEGPSFMQNNLSSIKNIIIALLLGIAGVVSFILVAYIFHKFIF